MCAYSNRGSRGYRQVHYRHNEHDDRDGYGYDNGSRDFSVELKAYQKDRLFHNNRSRGGGGSYDRGGTNDIWCRGRHNNRTMGGGKVRHMAQSQSRGRSGPRPRHVGSEDGDVDMERQVTFHQQNDRFNPYGGGGRNRRGQRGANNRARGGGMPYVPPNRAAANQWFKVMIPRGRLYGKDMIISHLNQTSAVPFQPLHFTTSGETAVFYVKERGAANALRDCSRRVAMDDGATLVLQVNPSNAPNVFNEEVKEKIKLVMSDKYDPATRLLDLSRFMHNSKFKEEELFLPLYRLEVGNFVVETIKNHIPELVTLDLSDNKLNRLEAISDLSKAAPALTNLSLKKNALSLVTDLEVFKESSIVDLMLDGNPLCDRYKDKPSAYITAIRKIFPKVTKLDGTDLPPPVTFEIEGDEAGVIPPTKGSFFNTEKDMAIISKFCTEYYQIFDTSPAARAQLVAAYHDQAFFSLCVCRNDRFRDPGNLLKMSRNLKSVDARQSSKQLVCGKEEVVAALAELPATRHDAAAFVVDVNFSSDAMLSFTVHGLFKEANEKRKDVFSFSRTFITVPQGEGIVIVNEVFNLSGATHSQQVRAFQQPAPTPSPSPALDAAPTPASPLDGLTIEQKQEMVIKFAAESTMNLTYAEQCLVTAGWHYEQAAQLFLAHHQAGKIPTEAFVK